MNKQTRFHIGYWIGAELILLVVQYFYTTAQKVAAIPYSQFQQLLHDSKVAEIGVSDRYIQGKAHARAWRRADVNRQEQGEDLRGSRYRSAVRRCCRGRRGQGRVAGN